MIISIKVPYTVDIPFEDYRQWRKESGMTNIDKEVYDGSFLDTAYFDTEEDAVMFRLKFGL